MEKNLDAVGDALALADRFFAAIERCDIDALRQLYADDAAIWHNYDPVDARLQRPAGQTVDDNLELLRVLPNLILNIRYEVWHQERTATGFVRQHIVTGKTPDGSDVRLPVCVVARVADGRIDSFYEYLDAGQLPASVLGYFAERARQSAAPREI